MPRSKQKSILEEPCRELNYGLRACSEHKPGLTEQGKRGKGLGGLPRAVVTSKIAGSFGHRIKCNTCVYTVPYVLYFLGFEGRTCRTTTKYSGAEGYNCLTRFVA